MNSNIWKKIEDSNLLNNEHDKKQHDILEKEDVEIIGDTGFDIQDPEKNGSPKTH